MASGKLNVIFHGTFVFDIKRDGIEVLIPKVPGHVYRIGNWLGETDLLGNQKREEPLLLELKPQEQFDLTLKSGQPLLLELKGGPPLILELKREEPLDLKLEPGKPLFLELQRPEPLVLELKGVKAGNGSLKPEHNLILKNRTLLAPVDLNPKLAARLRFPVPDKVVSPRRAEVRKEDMGILESSVVPLPAPHKTRYLATFHVFTYEFSDDAALVLFNEKGEGPLWEPGFAGSEKGVGFVNLHIFAAHENAQFSGELPHEYTALSRCFDLFKDLTRESKPPRSDSAKTSVFEEAELPPGVVREETEDLEPRMHRLAQMGRMKKENRDLNLLWFDSEALDSQPDACGSIGNDGRSDP